MDDTSAGDTIDGGYDSGYESCECFWGREPGRLVEWLAGKQDIAGADVLDAGCGEGKNAVWLDSKGCNVTAVDVSAAALRNARSAWGPNRVKWVNSDILDIHGSFDIVVAYGLLHCLPPHRMLRAIETLQRVTRPRGWNLIVAFNDRRQDLAGHPSHFSPTLMSHAFYLHQYRQWNIAYATDEDLREVHPDMQIPHTHSMTRMAARRSTDVPIST